MSLLPPLERRGQASAGDVQGTRRPFIPLGTRQDEERSPESSTLAQVQRGAAVAPPSCPPEGALSLPEGAQDVPVGCQEPPKLAQLCTPRRAAPSRSFCSCSHPVKGHSHKFPPAMGCTPQTNAQPGGGTPNSSSTN